MSIPTQLAESCNHMQILHELARLTALHAAITAVRSLQIHGRHRDLDLHGSFVITSKGPSKGAAMINR